MDKRIFLPLLLLISTASKAADTVTEYILDTVDSGDGSWPCLFYELNYNSDITLADRARWHSPAEDESYWREGRGPFSIDGNRFLVTQWQSSVHPILIRRHFTLTQEDLLKIEIGTVSLVYSYDENPVFWLNGTRLTAATGWNDNEYATFRLSGARKRLLTEGDNVLCVSLQQGAGGGHIDYGLSVTYDPLHTALTSATAGAEADNAAYNLLGQRLASPESHKGIVITQGKKILHP